MMNTLYFLMGFVAGAGFVLVLFTIWYGDDEELKKMDEMIRKLDELDRKSDTLNGTV